MKKQLINTFLLALLTTNVAYSLDKESSIEQSSLSTIVRLSTSYTKTASLNRDDYGSKLFFKIDMEGRYALGNSVAVNIDIGKWLGSGVISDKSGSVAYNISTGLEFALSGSYRNQVIKESVITKNKIIKNNKEYFITRTKESERLNDISGLKLGVHVNQIDFSKLSNPVYGYGAKFYYQDRLNKSSFIQYGLKYDYVNNKNVKVSLAQLFIGIGFFP